MSYVYIKSEVAGKGGAINDLFTVGFYVGEDFQPESDHVKKSEAEARVHWLNGGSNPFSADEVRILDAALGCYRDSIAAALLEDSPDDSEAIAPLWEKIKILGGAR